MNKTILLPGYKQEKELPVNYDEILNRELIIHPHEEFGPVYLCKLKKAYVSPYGVVFKNWKVVKESLYSMFLKNNFNLSFYKKIFLNKVKRVAGTSVVAHHAYFSNYYHFTSEVLPRIYLIRDLAPEVNLLLHEASPKFVQEYVSLFNFKNIIYIKDDELALTEALIFPTFTAPGLSQNGELMKEMAQWIKTQVPFKSDHLEGFPNIYISRGKAAYRKLLNEQELIAVIKDYDFKIVNLEDYSVAEQIYLLSQTRNLIAAQGAGMTNLLYMPAGGLIINLIHQEHHDLSFYNLTSSLNKNHDYILLQSNFPNPSIASPQNYNLAVDIEKIKYYLDTYLRK